MWKYNNKYQNNDFLLSLNLIKNKKKYIQTLYTLSNNVESQYKIHKIKKNNGKFRTIYEPSALLKNIQKRILDEVLNKRPISKYACAYHKDLSLRDNAKAHVNKKILLKLDIDDFFGNIDFVNVYNSCFPISLFPKQIGILFTYLCTYDEFLPQGAPTSAYISNLVMKDFDETIGEWCENNNISYTRYSDDMTFSGNFMPSVVIKKVIEQLNTLGLKLNKEKIHVIKNSANQTVTGVTVNEKVQVSKKYRKKIRQEVYFIEKFGIQNHLKKLNVDIDIKSYLRSLYGKILFVLQINPDDQEFKKYKELMKNIMFEN